MTEPAPHPMSQPPAIIRELFALLPPPGSSFPIERQAAWFRCFIEAANLTYGYVGNFEVTVTDDGVIIRERYPDGQRKDSAA